jgi:hypothetical protein
VTPLLKQEFITQDKLYNLSVTFCQVSWESGSTFTSDCYMVSRDAAYESAARNAVLSLQPGLKTDKVWYSMVPSHTSLSPLFAAVFGMVFRPSAGHSYAVYGMLCIDRTIFHALISSKFRCNIYTWTRIRILNGDPDTQLRLMRIRIHSKTLLFFFKFLCFRNNCRL